MGIALAEADISNSNNLATGCTRDTIIALILTGNTIIATVERAHIRLAEIYRGGNQYRGLTLDSNQLQLDRY